MRSRQPTIGLAGALLTVGALLLLGGCASVDDIWTAEGFSWLSVRQEGLAIGCVVRDVSRSVLEERALDSAPLREALREIGGFARSITESTPEEEVLYSELFRAKLQERDDYLQVRGAEELLLHLGAGRHTRLMEEYQRDGTVSCGTLAEIAECGVAQRYLLLARITRDEVKESLLADTPGDGWSVKTTTRGVTAAAVVFDLNVGAPVWRAQGRHEGGSSVPPYQGDQKEPEYPAPPTMEEVLQVVFANLAEELESAK